MTHKKGKKCKECDSEKIYFTNYTCGDTEYPNLIWTPEYLCKKHCDKQRNGAHKELLDKWRKDAEYDKETRLIQAKELLEHNGFKVSKNEKIKDK